MRVSRNRPGTFLSDASVVTIGNYDGVHLGHQRLIDLCRSLAGPNGNVAVVTFEPLPLAFFGPQSAPARLTSPIERVRLLDEVGVDLVWMQRFDAKLASMEPQDFIRLALVESLGARHVVTGDDFRFGHKRAGDLEMLAALGAQYGFESHVASTLTQDGQRVSSGAIREALANSDFETAARMLGRSYTIRGRVLKGQQLGRRLGYPTANLKITALPSPLNGVFAVRARVMGDVWREGVANLGVRPMVEGEDFLLEVHLFDFEGDLYGRKLEVEFVAKLRDEARFETMADMVGQMKLDEAQARKRLGLE
ncbi:MAG TPA: bifunctional riboflavin kinase/FAD synthetase [Xanthomonadales bacterium]|nr:bifunctional riboflavin kinase/FAD synthetase [Xanthomonadales bacterium]